MKTVIIMLLAWSVTAYSAIGQVTRSHANQFTINFLQIDESMNYGYVFDGPGFGYAYSARWDRGARTIGYEGRINLSYLKARGIEGLSLSLTPVRLEYLLKTGHTEKFFLGPYIITDYQYQLYPDFQSGYSFWFTNLSLGGALRYRFEAGKSRIQLSLNTTALGLSSRTPAGRDQYFFDLGLGYMVKFLHQDLQFGSWNRYNQTEMELRWQPREDSRLALSFLAQYYGYFDTPRLDMVNAQCKLILQSKNTKR